MIIVYVDFDTVCKLLVCIRSLGKNKRGTEIMIQILLLLEENVDLYIYKKAMILNLLKTQPCFDTLKKSPLQFPSKVSQSFIEK